ncbi:MAG: phosphate acyltransferase PlsX [Acidobacteria bacterium]|nr:phosphate acyltransferase PlsX [Acidobacteriota bacterium]
MKIALDAMGTDSAPRAEVEGAVRACREYGVGVILVGSEPLLRERLHQHGAAGLPLEVVHATEVVGMEEAALVAVRKKRDSSIRVAAQLVKEGRAQGLVSAGNTGAVMATARLVIGSLERVDRPALAVVIPTSQGKALLLDVGANADCKPLHLEQFAVMGHVFARRILGVPNPRIGLMSIGEEEIKGNELTREVHRSLKETALNFVGNVEGKDIYQGAVDVIVCDGFTGNVVLKTSEGLIETMLALLKKELSKTLSTKVGALLAQQAFRTLKKRLDYSEYGGALLLGVRKVCVICHGRSNANAIKNAIRVAHEFCANEINDGITAELSAATLG